VGIEYGQAALRNIPPTELHNLAYHVPAFQIEKTFETRDLKEKKTLYSANRTITKKSESDAKKRIRF
jgi:hypothetical protein